MTGNDTPDVSRAADVIQREVIQNGRDTVTVLRQLIWEGVDRKVLDRAFILAVERVYDAAVRGDMGFYGMFRIVRRCPFSCDWIFRLLTILTIPVTLAVAWILIELRHPGPYGLIPMALAAIASGFVFWCAGLWLVYVYRRATNPARSSE